MVAAVNAAIAAYNAIKPLLDKAAVAYTAAKDPPTAAAQVTETADAGTVTTAQNQMTSNFSPINTMLDQQLPV